MTTGVFLSALLLLAGTNLMRQALAEVEDRPLNDEARLDVATALLRMLALSMTAAAATTLSPWALLLLIPLYYAAGEQLPRAVGAAHTEVLVRVLGAPTRAGLRTLGPILWPMAGWLELLRPAPDTVSREELVRLLDDEPSGELDAEDRRLIQRILALSDTTIEGCMTPLVEVVAVPDSASITEVGAEMARSGRSRLPVYRDRIDNIIGIAHLRDLVLSADSSLDDLVRPPSFVPESKRVDALLKSMQRGHEHFAVVVDEYGGSVGIVTIEDLLEEIVGEIRDERDAREPTLRRTGPRSWSVPGRAEVEAISAHIGADLPELDGGYETVGGLVLAATGRIPAAGELIRIGPFRFLIEEANERAIMRLRVTVPNDP